MDIITTYVTALAPAVGALLTAIIMFVRIIASVKGMINDCRKQTDDANDAALAAVNAQLERIDKTVADLNASSELAAIKEQNQRLLADLDEALRLNAELLAKLNARGY